MFIVPNLVSEDDEQAPEHAHEVNEELDGMHDVVLVPTPGLLQDVLGVVHDEAAHHCQAHVQVDLRKL